MSTASKFAVSAWSIILVSVILDYLLPVEWSESPMYLLVTMVALTFAIFGWFLADSERLGVSPSRVLKGMIILFALVAVPYYRFRYTGTKLGLFFLAKCIGIFFGVIVGAATIVWTIIEVQAV